MNAFVQIAGWTLIHFLWQGAAIGWFAAAALRLCRRRSGNLRYLVACGGLMAMLAAPAATAWLLRPLASAEITASRAAVSNDSVGSANRFAAVGPPDTHPGVQ